MHVETLTNNDPRWTAALCRLRHDFYHLTTYVELEAQRMNATPEALLVSDDKRLFFIPYLATQDVMPALPPKDSLPYRA